MSESKEGQVLRMPRTEINQQTGPRYVVNLPVRAEWNEKKKHIVTEGSTEYVGPSGALVHLPQLPAVGSRITISIKDVKGASIKAHAEVLRLVRDLAQPLASLSILDATAQKKWRTRVWEPAASIKQQSEEIDEE